MSGLPIPTPPDWSIDWHTIDSLPWMQDMKGCPQNPDRHAEGDVWIHVHMVCEEMAALPTWRNLPENERRILFTAALLHDAAKPLCTRVESDGRISSKGHSWRGAIKARSILWRMDEPFEDREAACSIVRHHLVPFYLAGSTTPARLAIEVSQTLRCDHLAIMAEADARGRTCPNPEQLLEQIARFRAQAVELDCESKPFAFPSDHSRFLYFRDSLNETETHPPENFRSQVVMLCGLPGSGKDFWIAQHAEGRPVISLDSIGEELAVPPLWPQGEVLSRAREMAKEYLLAGTDFVWNSTNLSRNVRSEGVRLFHSHGARVQVVYTEASSPALFARNRDRNKRVSEKVVERLLDRWEVPDRTECHTVDYILS